MPLAPDPDKTAAAAVRAADGDRALAVDQLKSSSDTAATCGNAYLAAHYLRAARRLLP